MANNHRTSNGRIVDMDKIRLSHEEVIAVGNMKVNARGDQLGPGGQVVSTRNQNMNDYYKLHTPIAEVTEQPPVQVHNVSELRPPISAPTRVQFEPVEQAIEQQFERFEQPEQPDQTIEDSSPKIVKGKK